MIALILLLLSHARAQVVFCGETYPGSTTTTIDKISASCTGTIPDVSLLPRLTFLQVSSNQLTGTIPDFSNHPDLAVFNIVSNQIEGTVPDFSQHVKLRYLGLSLNQLTGTMQAFPNHPALTSLSCSHNQLSGDFPDLSLTPSLLTVRFSGNNWNCPIPDYSFAGDNDYSASQACVPDTTDAPATASATVAPLLSDTTFAGPGLEQPTADADACAQSCASHEVCAGWTWWPHSSWCKEHFSVANSRPSSHPTSSALSVNHACATNVDLRFDLDHTDNVFLDNPVAADVHQCCDACLANFDCVAFSYKPTKSKCVLLSLADGDMVASNKLVYYGRTIAPLG